MGECPRAAPDKQKTSQQPGEGVVGSAGLAALPEPDRFALQPLFLTDGIKIR